MAYASSRANRYQTWLADRQQAESEQTERLSRGMAARREAQLRSEERSLLETEKRSVHRIAALQTQFQDIGRMQQLEGLDPAFGAQGGLPIPYRDINAMRLAVRYKWCEWMAGISGSIVAGGLFWASIAGPPLLVAALAFAITGLIGGVVAGATIAASDSDPRNPDALRRLKRLASYWGIVLLGALAAVFILRFAAKIETLNLISVPLTALEMSLFVLCGLFAGLSNVHSWSGAISDAFEVESGILQRTRERLAIVGVELLELQFQRDLKDADSSAIHSTAPAESSSESLQDLAASDGGR
jgi:hypothetical protein